MACTSIVYNNNVFNIDTFINNILYDNIKKDGIPISEIKEYYDYYSIIVSPFYQKYNFFEIYYKNSFLILQIKYKTYLSKILATKIFYLPNINTNKISHIYFNNHLSLKIPKLNFNTSY